MKLLVLMVLLGVTSCQKAPAPLPECTFETALVPGVPGSPGHLIPSSRNPNGDSELAALMRHCVDDWKEARAALKTGQAIRPRFPVHRRMRCSWPTDPADRNQAFDALAVGYLTRVQAFDARPSVKTYEGVLDGCKACHEVTCGGPLQVIESLRTEAL
jgi:hypothetical protein